MPLYANNIISNNYAKTVSSEYCANPVSFKAKQDKTSDDTKPAKSKNSALITLSLSALAATGIILITKGRRKAQFKASGIEDYDLWNKLRKLGVKSKSAEKCDIEYFEKMERDFIEKNKDVYDKDTIKMLAFNKEGFKEFIFEEGKFLGDKKYKVDKTAMDICNLMPEDSMIIVKDGNIAGLKDRRFELYTKISEEIRNLL